LSTSAADNTMSAKAVMRVYVYIATDNCAVVLCVFAHADGRPRSSFSDVALHDCQTCQIGRPYRDAQDRLLWKDKTFPHVPSSS